MSLIKHRDRTTSPTEQVIGLLPSLRWFDDLFEDFYGGQPIKVEEFVQDGTLVVKAELPGIDPQKDVEVTVEGGLLNIRAERREEQETTEKDFHRRELRYGSFARSIALPDGVDEAAVTAKYVNGVLEVRAPLPTEPEKEPAHRVPVTDQ
jgi:HSP20 family protein